jgi:small subunit ribosomal protein S14
MAKTSLVVKDRKKLELAKRSVTKRQALKDKIIDMNLSEDDRREAMFALNKMPKKGSKIHFRRRCALTGSPRSVYQHFELNRISFRKMALQGLLPGVTKASW